MNDDIFEQTEEKRPKGKKVTLVLAIIVSIIVFVGLVGVIGAGIFANKLLDGMPELDVDDLHAPNSTVIYDSEGNQIYELGLYLRENVKYEEMPNCLIDAFLAVEDSRFFEHVGFDIPRFSKAILENIKAGSFAQGGSTITMQLIKNTYFSIDDGENSTIAAAEGMSGVQRKMQEIVLALDLDFNRKMSKQDIISTYINKVNFGDNIRGVEKASEYYFGKRISDVNYVESAFLAGIINAPTTYNPYNNLSKNDSYYLDPDSDYLKNAQDRKDEVLYLMNYHGYISDEEYELGKAVRVEDLLSGISDNFSETTEINQQYIDVVIEEIYEVTGENPYTTPMRVYTNMDPYMQQTVYDIQNEADYTGIKFTSDLVEDAIVIMNNQTGEVIAIGGGRGENEQSRTFNRATDSYINPGSSIKPVLDYALAFETLNWSTGHVITDQPVWLYGGDILIQNSEERYFGDVTLTQALADSLNTCAVKTLVEVIDAKDEEYCIDYLNSIGFDFDIDDFDLQFAIGGNRCLVTPMQLAGAHAMLINDGMYVEPHTINTIKFTGNREDYVADTTGTRALSSEAAFQTAYLEYTNVYGGYSNSMDVLKTSYPVYAKTGTSDYGDSGKEYGIPYGARKSGALVAQTNKYTVCTWIGFDKAEKGAYFTYEEYSKNTKGYICKFLLDELKNHFTEDYDPSTGIETPEGITEVEHILGAYPYAKPTAGYQTVKGYISKKYLEENPLVDIGEVYAKLETRVLDGQIKAIDLNRQGNILTANFYAYFGIDANGNEDITTINWKGAAAIATGRSYFKHYNYVGQAPKQVNYSVIVGDTPVVNGVTEFGQPIAVEIPDGLSVVVCASANGTAQYCRISE